MENKHDLIKVIDKPWSPAYEAKKYLAETEPLLDFEIHLQGGIEELKTPSSNVLTLINEISQLSEISLIPMAKYQNETSDNLVLVNMPQESNFMKQISGIHKKLNEEGRHPVGRNGVYQPFRFS